MLTNFDLIWLRVRQLIDSLLEAEGESIDEELFANYCEAFEQLTQVAEAEPEGVTDEKLEVVHLYLRSLEAKYSEAQKELQKRISEERLKAVTFSKYAGSDDKERLINKKT
jgi:lipase chaperone LimK